MPKIGQNISLTSAAAVSCTKLDLKMVKCSIYSGLEKLDKNAPAGLVLTAQSCHAAALGCLTSESCSLKMVMRTAQSWNAAA